MQRHLEIKTFPGKLKNDTVLLSTIKNEIFVSKWKVKPIFQGAYRLSGTGIVEWKSLTVGCNLKQFDGLTCVTLTPPGPPPPDFTTDLRHALAQG